MKEMIRPSVWRGKQGRRFSRGRLLNAVRFDSFVFDCHTFISKGWLLLSSTKIHKLFRRIQKSLEIPRQSCFRVLGIVVTP